MSYNLSQISRAAQEFESPRSEVERIRDELLPCVDLDETQLEVFAEYLAALQAIGVNLQNEGLQEALNANPQNIEFAIQAVLDHAEQLRQKHEEFVDQYHSTNYLAQALQEGFKPDQADQ
jgi:hypothetical protein